MFSGQVVVNEDAAERLHHLCQLLRIDFGKEIVSLPAGAGGSKAKRIKRKITNESGSRAQKSTTIRNNATTPSNSDNEKNLENEGISTSLRSKQGLNLSPQRNPHAPGSHTGENKSPVTRKRRFWQQGSLAAVKTEGEAETTSPVTRKQRLCPPASSSSSVVKTEAEAEAEDRRASTSGLIEGARDTRLYCYCQKPTSKDLIGCDHCPQVSRVPIPPSQCQLVPSHSGTTRPASPCPRPRWRSSCGCRAGGAPSARPPSPAAPPRTASCSCPSPAAPSSAR